MNTKLNKKSQSSIRKQITKSTLLIVTAALLLMIIISEIVTYSTATNLSKSDMQTMTNVAANYVRADFETYCALAESAGCNERLADPTLSDEEKLEIMTRLAEQYGAKRGNIVRADGVEITQGQDFSDREYYIAAMQGKSSIYEPTISRLTGEIIEIVAAPLWENGEYGTTPVGCAYFITQPEYINDIMRELQISENCYAFILDANGQVIAHSDSSNVLSEEYVVPEELSSAMLKGGSGVMTIKKGNKIQASYAPIPNSNNWSLAVCAKQSDFLSDVYVINGLMIVLAILSIIIAVILTVRMSKRIAGPITECADRLTLLAQGDLNSPIPTTTRKDEIKTIIDATTGAVGSLQNMIHDIDRVLNEMANGNLAVDVKENEAYYVGDFKPIADSLVEINKNLITVMSEIDNAGNQVSCGSEQVSIGAQSLSQSSVEQAASVEELSHTIDEINSEVDENTSACEEANALVLKTASYIGEANEKMNQLTEAMNNINDKSSQIGAIIKTIEDIAFQTNILALNAAVEAARAGEAGKGFAVVADEVRNLAAKSSDAAKDTNNLIAQSVKAVEEGNKITVETVNAMETVNQYSKQVSDIVNNISSASKKQAESIQQVNHGIAEISNAVQMNSATAEESAASAEELSSQSVILKKLINRFQFNSSDKAPDDFNAINFTGSDAINLSADDKY